MNNRRLISWREQENQNPTRRRRLNPPLRRPHYPAAPNPIRYPHYRPWMVTNIIITVTLRHPEGLTPDQQYDLYYQAQQVSMRSRAYRWLLHGNTEDDQIFTILI